MKQKHASPEERLMGMGDAWTYYALGPDSKLIIAYRAGKRDARTTQALVSDLASRLAERVQLTTDGLFFYKVAVE